VNCFRLYPFDYRLRVCLVIGYPVQGIERDYFGAFSKYRFALFFCDYRYFFSMTSINAKNNQQSDNNADQ